MAKIALATTTGYYNPVTIQEFASTTAQAYDLDVEAFVGTLRCESNFKYTAIGAAGEIGVAQIYPKAHPDVTHEQMKDPYYSVIWTALQWKQGNEHIWTCYRLHYEV